MTIPGIHAPHAMIADQMKAVRFLLGEELKSAMSQYQPILVKMHGRNLGTEFILSWDIIMEQIPDYCQI